MEISENALLLEKGGAPGPRPPTLQLAEPSLRSCTCQFSALGTQTLPKLEMFKKGHHMTKTERTHPSTVINIHSDSTVPDHVVWSLFNTLFFNWCCLGFVAYAYSVKVCGVPGSWAVGGLQALPGGICGPWV